MAHSPAFRPDPFQPDDAHALQPQRLDPAQEEAPGGTLSHYVQVLSASGGEGVSADLAVDLVLNDLLRRACAATGATAAAIALSRDGEMICRAATGETAPDLGVALDTMHGLSGECVHTGIRQCCTDTEYDPRVDAAACQRLGVRSIVVVPIKKQQELIGIVEIFSPHANRFDDQQADILERFAADIADNLDRAKSIPSAEPSIAAIAEPTPQEDVDTLPGPPALPEPASTEAPGDPWTGVLLLCVIVLAVMLGWFVGWSKWRSTPSATAHVPAHATQDVPSEPAIDASPTAPAKPAAPPSAPSGQTEPRVKTDGLIVYQNGKVIFPPAVRGEKKNASSKIDLGADGQLRLAPDIAKQYLAARVEPQYPEAARSRGIQGPVTVEIVVGKDGSVQKLTPISGDPELIPAATQAIQQWRFHPFFHQGEPQPFSTTVAVIFRLAGK